MTGDAGWVGGQVERRWLDEFSFVDIGRGWLRRPDEVYAALAGLEVWQQRSVWRYDHAHADRRLSASWRPSLAGPHPAVLAAHKALRARYGVELRGVTASWYRDGRDSLGAHRDRDLRWCDSTLIAVLSLGASRPWLLMPTGGHGGERDVPVVDVAPAAGDLLVMGGRAQADWLHAVPSVPGLAEGRISLQWRWTSGQGRPEVGGGSRAPRRFGHGR